MPSYAIQIGRGGFLATDPSSDFDFGTGDFTLEAWVKTLKGGTIIGRKGTAGGGGNGGFLLVAYPDGTIKFATDSGFGFFEIVSSKTSIVDGVWHHIAAVRRGVELSLYLDGQGLNGTSRGNAQPPLDLNNSLRLTIGTVDQEQEPQRFFEGLVAEARIWSLARTENDIKLQLYEQLPADAPGLVGYWAADFGLFVDFSSRRHATSKSGMISDITYGPPVLARAEIACLFLFAGQYATGTKFGGASGQWQPSPPLYITRAGIVIFGDTRINGAVFDGNSLSWPPEGNPNAGSFTFKLKSDSSYYWPEGLQATPLFEGWVQPPGSGRLDFRGSIQPQRQLCGVILSNAFGQIVSAGNGLPGAVLTLGDKDQMPGQHEHFCVYDNNSLLFMRSGAAVGISGAVQAGSQVVLKDAAVAGTDTKWSFEADGTIRPKTNTDLAVSVTSSNQSLVLADANPNDASQKWISLSLAQFVWNGNSNSVLTAAEGSQPGVFDKALGQPKSEGSPNQLWYFAREAVFVDINAFALTVVGPPAVGASIGLAKYQALDSQRFTSNGAQIIHIPSGLSVKLDVNMNAVLAAADDSSAEATWRISPLAITATATQAAQSNAKPRSKRSEVDEMIDYTIYITTADTIFAGTDDRVEISLKGSSQSTALIELSNSETHSDPFERGQTDRFTVRLKNVGRLTGIYFRYGENTWFGGERWVVSAVAVYDPTTLTSYGNSTVGNGAQYEMPYKTTIGFSYAIIGGSGSTMSVGKAPTQDAVTQGWVDHTWVKVADAQRTTYFDCGGGHEGPGTTNDIVTTTCDLNAAVRMATSFPIEPSHPYQSVYGHDDVNGKETCGVRASGFRNWDGQCHQMANRLLYIGNPLRTLADAGDKRPTGYGLTCLLWGPYGVGFSEWCQGIGIRPPDPNGDAIFDYVQRYLGNRQQSYGVMYHAINMQAALRNDPENPQGPDVKTFFRAVHNDGVNNSTIGNLTCLPEDKVLIEEQ